MLQERVPCAVASGVVLQHQVLCCSDRCCVSAAGVVFQRQVAGTEDLQAVQSIKLRVIGRETSLQRLCVYVPNLTELNLDGSSVGSLR